MPGGQDPGAHRREGASRTAAQHLSSVGSGLPPVPIVAGVLWRANRAKGTQSRGGKCGDEAIPGADEAARGAATVPKAERDRGVSAPVGESRKRVEAVFGARETEGGHRSDVGRTGLQRGTVD